ncbi:MAG: hypothetical protein RJR35_05415 [Thermoanaerobacterales bacterium]|nr:hypothetical protein [Thermoanaerobacterales bacterium]
MMESTADERQLGIMCSVAINWLLTIACEVFAVTAGVLGSHLRAWEDGDTGLKKCPHPQMGILKWPLTILRQNYIMA